MAKKMEDIPPVGFTTSAAALDQIIQQFKSGNLPLEEAMTLFEEGVQHLKVCQQALSTSHGQVSVLVESLQETGKSVTQPFLANPED